MYRTEKEWIEVYQKCGALWIHDGNPKRPHALLTSGNHSSGFFNSEKVMEDPALLDQAASDLAEIMRRNEGFSYGPVPSMHGGMMHVDRVVGPAMGAITLAHDLARHMQCRRAYTEKSANGVGPISMVFGRTEIQRNEYVLLVEDVITTGGSIVRARKASRYAGGIVLPFFCALVNRSGATRILDEKIIALINKEMPIWAPDKCPLCKQGSTAIRPKGAENWALLNATY